jgi:uncharacterized RDD family membrane protein YckC
MDCPLCGTPCTCSVPSVAARMYTSRGTLTTSESVGGIAVSNPSRDARARMYPTEPNESQVEPGASHGSADNQSWRSEVASRVNNYRARRNSGGDEQSPALDFGPATEAHSFEVQSTGTVAMGAHPRASNAFDTNYYRRLNAESMAQSFAGTMTAAATATAPDEDFYDAPADLEPECEPAEHEELCDDLTLDLEAPADADEDFLGRYRISELEADSVPEPVPPPAAPKPVTFVQGNLIVFRRPLLEPPLVPTPSRDELAEPMNNRPRILEVPEDIMPAVQGSLFPEIRLDADEQEASHCYEPEIEVPLRVAPVSERLLASFMDWSFVAAASLVFAAMAWRSMPEVPHTKPFWMVMGVVPILLWAVYQHLFLLYAGRTPGMSITGIRLSTFDGHTPEWEQRRSRARYMFISFAPVALGFLWALVDEDTLCWHDRISQTFPTTE